MRAVVHDRFGPAEVLSIREVPDPTPRAGELVIAVRTAALNPKDVLIRKGKMWPMSGRGFPRPTGFDFAGEVVTGAGDLRPGDAVFGMLDGFRGGAFAEKLIARPGQVAQKPAALSWIDAAAVPLVGQTALQALRDLARVRPGQSVCVHGASGGLGTMVVQVARALGAEVTGVASARNAELVRSLGATETIDYATGEQRRRRFDVFVDCFGDHPPERVQAAVHVSVIMRVKAIARELLARAGVGSSRLVVVRSRREDLDTLAGWLVEGKIRAVIDRTLPLAEIAEGHRAIETKRTRGKIVLNVA